MPHPLSAAVYSRIHSLVPLAGEKHGLTLVAQRLYLVLQHPVDAEHRIVASPGLGAPRGGWFQSTITSRPFSMHIAV
jgi:hypothetical protein